MSRGWVRAVQTNFNNSGFFGHVPMINIAPDQTVLRSYWNVGLIMTLTNPGQYPPGGSILRVGLLWDNFTEAGQGRYTPITDASQDWMDIETIHPRVVLASATQNIWHLNWDFEIDQSVKSQRKNETSDTYALYVAYEFSLHDAVSGFTIPWWTSSVDAYVNTP